MKKLCEYFILEKTNVATLCWTGLTWVMDCSILWYTFTWAQTFVKFALCKLNYRNSVFCLCVYTAALPHTHTHIIWICLLVSFTLIIVFKFGSESGVVEFNLKKNELPVPEQREFMQVITCRNAQRPYEKCVRSPVCALPSRSYSTGLGALPNDKWDQAGPSGASAFIFSAKTQRSLKATMDELSI